MAYKISDINQDTKLSGEVQVQGDMNTLDAMRLANNTSLEGVTKLDFTNVVVGDKQLQVIMASPHLNRDVRLALQPNSFAGKGLQDPSLRNVALRQGEPAVTVGDVREHFGIKIKGPKYGEKPDLPPEVVTPQKRPAPLTWVKTAVDRLMGK